MNDSFDFMVLDSIDENGNMEDGVYSIVYETFYQSYINYVSQYTHSFDYSVEIVNSFFLRVPEVLYKLKIKDSASISIANWLFICFRNHALNIIMRSPKKSIEINREIEFEQSSQESNDSRMILIKTDMERLLTNEERQVINLRYLQELEYQTISKILHMKVWTVKYRAKCGIEKLKKAFEEESIYYKKKKYSSKIKA